MILRHFLLSGSLLLAFIGCYGRPQDNEDPNADKPNAEQGPRRPSVNADILKDTIVTPYLGREIVPGKNVVWCATFQMAWDRLKKVTGGAVETRPGALVVTMLNREALAAADVPETGAFGIAGSASDVLFEDMREQVSRIPGAHPSLIPEEGGLPEDALVLYAYLLRSLRFQTSFDLLEERTFGEGDRKVKYFGTEGFPRSPETRQAQASQVRVIWHRFVVSEDAGQADGEAIPDIEDEEYVIELLTLGSEDRLILAKIAPAPNLKETVEFVTECVKHPNSKTTENRIPPELERLESAAHEGTTRQEAEKIFKSVSDYSCLLPPEYLRIPYVRFDLTKQYDELIGQVVVSGGAELEGKSIVDARQRIKFNLNEGGLRLESEARMSVFGDMPFRDFSFTGPFLVLLMRKGAERPYFALWVANPEVLE